MLIAVGLVNAQPLTGIKSIPGNYLTVQAAIADLNSKTVGAGGVIFNVAANHTETFTSVTAGLITVTGTAADTIVFRKDPGTSGNNPKITSFLITVTSATDGIIKIAGGDYITFDGIDLQENPSNTATTKMTEWGYALVKKQNTAPFDGCQHVTIRNCTITLNKTNTSSVGIYTGNHIATSITGLTITATTDASNNCHFYNNTITNVYIGIGLNGFSAASPYSLYDHNNIIGQSGKNRIFNFGGSNTGAYGVYATNQDSIKVMNDSIAGGSGNTTIVAGIYLQSGINSDVEISGNYISVTKSATGGNNLHGVYNAMGSSTIPNTVAIHDNTIKNCSYPTTSAGNLYGILNIGAPDTVRIYNNEISGSTYSGTATGVNGHYGIRSAASGTVQFISNNYIHDLTNTSTGGLTLIYTASFTTSNFISNNLYNCSGNGGTIYGFYATTTLLWNVYNNNLNNISSNNGSAATTLVHGIYIQGASTANVYNNFVCDLKANAAIADPSIVGINIIGGTTSNVYYNTVYLNASSSGSTFGSAAVSAPTSPIAVLRNNIFVNQSTPGATGHTVAYRRGGPSLSTYSSGSDNNCFYAGAEGPANLIFYNGTTGDESIAAFKARVSPRDAHSFSEIPPFKEITTQPFNIHLSDTIPTFCESGGSTITTPNIVTDIDYDPRFPNPGYPSHPPFNTTAPDVGADEFGGIPNDLTPPVISYIPLANTSSLAPRTLIASITDVQSGVPISGPGLPVLYWKINNAAMWDSATGSFIGTDQYGFSFGSGTITGDVVYYYICAQDGFLTPNVAVNPAEGADGLTFDPPYCSVPPYMPNGYRIVGTLPAGNYLIGGTGNIPSAGCTYVDITQAFADVNDVIERIEVTNGGSDYSPYSTYVTLLGGGGSGAVAEAVIDTAGAVVAIEVSKNGEGYYTAPTVVIVSGTGTGATAIAHISAGKEITGPVNFIIDTSYRWTEENYFPLHLETVVGSSAANTITLKPGPLSSPEIFAYSGFSVFKLNGVDYFTLDGSNNGSSSKDLTLSFMPSAINSAVVWIASASENDGATHNTIKNCVMHGSGSYTYSYAVIFSGGTASIENSYYPLTPNSYNTFENNTLYWARNGIVTLGKSTTELDEGLTISNNQIGNNTAGESVTTIGIFVENQNAGSITGNHIQNIIYNDHYHEITGINIYNSRNMDISRNEIHNLSKTVSGSCWPVDGILQRATAFSTDFNPSNNMYANNVVYDLTNVDYCDEYTVVGIHNNGGRGDRYYYNSVYLTGQISRVGSLAACFSNGQAVNAGDASFIEVKNNIFFMNGYSAVGSYPNDSANFFSHYSTLGSYAGSIIDYNDLFVSVTGKARGFAGHMNSLDYSSLPAWQSATLQETASISADPMFVTGTSLIPLPGSPVLGAGVPIPGITTDFLGNLRNTTNPSIGAYENSMASGKYWNGSVSADWNDGSNWTPSGVPLASDDLTIIAGTPFSCTLNSIGLECNNITVSNGATITITNGSEITVYGNFLLMNSGNLTNDGVLNLKGNLVNEN